MSTNVSPHAILHPVPIGAVKMHDGFWLPRMEANRAAGIPAFLAWLDRDDQLEPFRAFSGGKDSSDDPEIRSALRTLEGNYKGLNRNKLRHPWRANALTWMESCAYIIQASGDSEVRELLDQLVTGVVAAHKNEEFKRIYYGDDFENSYGLATPGHLIQAAIAHHTATGRVEFLECAKGVADSVYEKFHDKRFPDHSCIEMALVELYRTTGDEKYLNLARHFLTPLLEQPSVIGSGFYGRRTRHVVRATYLCSGGADYYGETGDRAFLNKLSAIWDDMTAAKLHLTGQLAVDGEDPELINSVPYDLSVGVFGNLWAMGMELCESVGNAYWNWRMLAVNGDGKYADLFERTLYNGFLAHVSLDNKTFFYLCPLTSDGDHAPRSTWANPSTSCCSPNALRLIASLPGYIFSTSDSGLWIHLYDNCHLDWKLESGTKLNLTQRTRYPWDGEVTVELEPEKPTTFDLNLRIPGWCKRANVKVNGQDVQVPVEGGSYCRLEREWSKGDRVTLNLSMPVVSMVAHPKVTDFQDKVALTRGPLVYCFEAIDNADVEVWDIEIMTGWKRPRADDSENLYEATQDLSQFEAVYQEGLLGGVNVLRGPNGNGKKHPAKLTAIPYYTWDNRGRTPMRAWVNE